VSESELYGEILAALSRNETRLWRQQSLLAWAGPIVQRTATTVTLLHPHAIKVGMPGLADLGGFTRVLIEPEMVGSRLAVACQIEVKYGRRRATDEQAAFIAMVRLLGGRAGVARSVEEASAIVSGR
jgi:hypothetical protein